MEETRNKPNSRVILGIILIFIGVVFLLSTASIITMDVPHVIFSPPFFLAVIGLLIMFNSRKRTLGAILFTLGVFFLVPRIFPWIDYDEGIFVPVIVILIGVYIIFRNRTKHQRIKPVPQFTNTETPGSTGENTNYSHQDNLDIVDDVAIFGGGHKIFNSSNFKGGNITAIFGGSEIDLVGCKLADGEHVLDVLAIFGGTEIIVPKDWNVRLNITPIFGGFSNKIRRDPGFVPDPSKVLIIKGLCMFGGGELKSF